MNDLVKTTRENAAEGFGKVFSKTFLTNLLAVVISILLGLLFIFILSRLILGVNLIYLMMLNGVEEGLAELSRVSSYYGDIQEMQMRLGFFGLSMVILMVFVASWSMNVGFQAAKHLIHEDRLNLSKILGNSFNKPLWRIFLFNMIAFIILMLIYFLAGDAFGPRYFRQPSDLYALLGMGIVVFSLILTPFSMATANMSTGSMRFGTSISRSISTMNFAKYLKYFALMLLFFLVYLFSQWFQQWLASVFYFNDAMKVLSTILFAILFNAFIQTVFISFPVVGYIRNILSKDLEQGNLEEHFIIDENDLSL